MSLRQELDIDWDARCAEILRCVEDVFESRESDHDPDTRWAGGDWRIGRSGTHRSRIADLAEEAVPDWVLEGAERFYEREET